MFETNSRDYAQIAYFTRKDNIPAIHQTKSMPETYDPNCEATNTETVIAGHWELLRRNPEFCSLSKRWLKSETFRRSHALSQNYHDSQNHTPRCAWDWMLTASQRASLAGFQIEKLRWFRDRDFNFGPIICYEQFPPAAVTKNNWREFLRVDPMPDAPSPVTIKHSWNCAPDFFKQQFRLAYAPPDGFSEINARLREHSVYLANIASRLKAGDPLKESSIMADYLFALGNELRDLAEFSKVFKIPRRGVSEKRFQSFLEQIHKSFKSAGLLTPTKTHETHASYQGTTEDWRWFLEAERLGLDIRKSADVGKLAELYSEDLRQRTMRGKAPARAKAHGHSGSKFPSRVIKNRRSTMKRHVRAIEKWIRAAYPRQILEPGAAAS